MSENQIYLITKLLNEGIITADQAREMTEIVLEKEYSRKHYDKALQKIFAY